MTIAAIVAAAGRGERLGAEVPKALLPVAGRPLVVHAVRMLREAGVETIVVAAPSQALEEMTAVLPDAVVVAGGATRQESVRLALAALPATIDVVLVHDAARGLAPVSVAAAVIAALNDGADAVVPVVPLADTVKEVDATGGVVRTVDRSALRAIQTPQGFRRSVLEKAHAEPVAAGSIAATDDAALVEALGVRVATVAGAAEALKVTTPADVRVAELIASAGTHRVR